MPDEALLSKLRSLGVDIDRETLESRFPGYLSAQDLSEAIIAEAKPGIRDAEIDWIWIAVTCLWERWQPNLPNTEMVDDKMQAGYTALQEKDTLQACRLWLDTWRAILAIMERADIHSLDAFDDVFGGMQSVFNWVQDLEMELHNAGLQDSWFFQERIALCETMLNRFAGGRLSLENFKTALAESLSTLGDREKADQLFRDWLVENPQWGWGWIAWSDCYGLFADDSTRDWEKAEQILQEGLAQAGVEGRADVLERLADLYDEGAGRSEEAAIVREQVARLRQQQETRTITLEAGSSRTALPDAQVVERLTQVKGIARWTAEMFLIFSLGRPDVFPYDDLGIRTAIRNHYGLTDLPDKATSLSIAASWRPYASVATWYCWRTLDLARKTNWVAKGYPS